MATFSGVYKYIMCVFQITVFGFQKCSHKYVIINPVVGFVFYNTHLCISLPVNSGRPTYHLLVHESIAMILFLVNLKTLFCIIVYRLRENICWN